MAKRTSYQTRTRGRVGGMSDESASPFVPGARVAVQYGHSGAWVERFVAKAYKNGNFTLKDDKATPPRQWRPSRFRGYGDNPKVEWTARLSGESWSRTIAKFWNADVDQKIREDNAEAKRRDRFRVIGDRIRNTRPGDVTDAMLDQIEAALAVSKAEGKSP